MRVTLPLSDRVPEQDDWRSAAACKDMDAREFDDGGTDDAHAACEGCDVVAECSADLFRGRPFGVYRAGRYWPEKGISEARAEAEATRAAR